MAFVLMGVVKDKTEILILSALIVVTGLTYRNVETEIAFDDSVIEARIVRVGLNSSIFCNLKR